MKEISVLKCDAGYGPHNSDWIVVREDDNRFVSLCQTTNNEPRPVKDSSLYGDSTAYDYQGPEDGPINED